MQGLCINKIAVLGAGVMGAQIAAHCVNAGLETLLFDLASEGGNRNTLVNKAITHLSQLKPTPLATLQTSKLIKARNYEDDLAELAQCDLIIEAIAEQFAWKKALYEKIIPYLHRQSILVTNTSGISINSLASVLPFSHQDRFCGMHFFNPPRYMHLAELIPAKNTSPHLLNHLETWLTSVLGKGVVIARDTPNFIANRIGVFSLLVTMYHAKAMNMGLDEVDALSGSLIGRPKSATFRTMDVVGLDVMQHVVQTMEDQLIEDPWHPLYKLPDWLTHLIKEGYLGQKVGQGIYKKNGQVIEVYDIHTATYRPVKASVVEEVKQILLLEDDKQRLAQLSASQHPQAKFLLAYYRDLFHYCAYHLSEIANTVSDVDLAMCWGFGWQKGPFELWQASGVLEVIHLINQAIANQESQALVALPDWLSNNTKFYTNEGAFCPQIARHVQRNSLPIYKKQFFKERVCSNENEEGSVLYQNEGVVLSHFQEDIALLSFKTKGNTIGQSVLDGMQEAITVAENKCRGLIIYQPNDKNFSLGANLHRVFSLIQDNRWQELDAMLTQFQHVVLQLKYSSIPTIAALRGRALGGGCELMMHCDAVIAAFESYPGLVEVSVGLIPGGGGCKEMALRAYQQAGDADLLLFIQPYFHNIATAAMASSAADALLKGYLRPQDGWVMHANEVLYACLAKINSMLALNYQKPFNIPFKVAGREGASRLQAGLVNWLEGGFISQHDYLIGQKLANALCGGNIPEHSEVDEKWMLAQEKEAFLSLAQTSLTQAKIQSLLQKGKPLRN